MSDFNLSQALCGSSDLDETEFESSSFHMTGIHDAVFKLDEGLDLVVSHNPNTLQSVAYLLLAVNRMKTCLRRRVRELRADELSSAIMDSLVTDTIVERTQSSSSAVKRTFLRRNSMPLCTLCDVSQKDVVRASGKFKLQAITLQGGENESKVNFEMSRYATPSGLDSDGLTVLLSIADSNVHMSCSMEDGKAVLKLEECNEEDLKNISENGSRDRFLFYKRQKGVSLNTFESVKCEGWFISTSVDGENQPVEMCRVDTATRVTCFKVNYGVTVFCRKK